MFTLKAIITKRPSTVPLSLYCLLLSLATYPPAQAASSYFCGKNSQYIKTGMSQAEVIQACGEPQAKQKSSQSGRVKQPVTQMIFKVANQKAGYGAFPIATGGSTKLAVSVANNKIVSLSFGGQSTQSVSICGGRNVSVGSPASALSACGQPTMTNNTYVDIPTGKTDKVETWVIKPDQYSRGIRLTFVNGALQSIDN